MSKKKEEPERILLGRPGNNLKMGIVGLPNVGKSTLFNILTKMNVPAENFPFCTIDPNLSRVVVPDERFDFLVRVHHPRSEVPAVLHVTDIAGLVRGASEGEGLGNAFLSHISAVDGIYQVVRIFEDSDVTHVEGSLDPIRDLEIITDELLLKDEEHLSKRLETVAKVAARADRSKQQELEVVQRLLEHVKAKKLVRFGDWSAKDIEVINPLCLLTAKPVVYLVNMSADDYLKKKSRWLPKIKQWIDEHGGEPLLPFSAAIEAAILDKTPDQVRAAFPDPVVSAIPRIIKAGYACLSLVNFFTAGEDEVRAWTIRKGTKAPEAAGVIHTDFMNGFICAEVMAFNDFKEHPSESECKAAGKYRQQGKAYVVEDGDIMYFKANTGAGLSKKK